MMILVGGGAYFVGIHERPQPMPYLIPVASTPLSSQYATATPSASLKTESFQLSKETVVSGNQTIDMSFEYPSDWDIQTLAISPTPEDLIKNCIQYTLSNPISGAKLTVAPICSEWYAEYNLWPEDTVILKENKNKGNDGHTSQLVRYYDALAKIYKYVEAYKEENKVMYVFTVPYGSQGNFAPISVYLSAPKDVENSILKDADKIVQSIKAN